MDCQEPFLIVISPENLELRLPLAGPASRALAWLVDCSILVSLLSVAVGCVSFFSILGQDVVWALLLAVGFVLVNGYFVYFEVMGNGQTPGKRALGLRTLRCDGRSLTLRDSFLRNLLRTVDWMPWGYSFGVVVMLAGSKRQRLGDFVAGTVVVRETSLPPWRAPEAVYQVDEAARLKERDLQWIRLFQQWSPLLLPAFRRRAARRLAQGLSDRMGVEPPEERSSEGFLADLADSRGSRSAGSGR